MNNVKQSKYYGVTQIMVVDEYAVNNQLQQKGWVILDVLPTTMPVPYQVQEQYMGGSNYVTHYYQQTVMKFILGYTDLGSTLYE